MQGYPICSEDKPADAKGLDAKFGNGGANELFVKPPKFEGLKGKVDFVAFRA